MTRFRKKPVVIEAVQYIGGEASYRKVAEFVAAGRVLRDELGVHIITFEGTMHVTEGDWVIKGVAGEFYPCKPDIFEQTYEAVDEN